MGTVNQLLFSRLAENSRMTETEERPVAVALENRLMSDGIYLLEFERLDGEDDDPDADAGDSDDASIPIHERDGAGARIEYETVAEIEYVTSEEVGAVVRTLLAIADERDWTPGRFEATSLTTDGDVRGSWHVEATWFEQLHDELSELEFSKSVLETINGQTETR